MRGKISRVLLVTLVLVISFSLMAVAPVAANGNNTIEVSQPVQVTSSEYYERGQSIVYDGTNYWLFYGRSASCTGTYQSDNPDVYNYALYYKKATTVAGLADAAASAVTGDSVLATNTFLGETGAVYYDGKVWVFASISSLNYPGRNAVYGWYSTDGSSWTSVGPFWDNKLSGSLHHDEVVFGDELWIVEGAADGDFRTRHGGDPYDPTTQAWDDSQLDVGEGSGGLVHFFVDGGQLYLGALRTGTPRANVIYKYYASWVKVNECSSTGWDPTLFKVDSTYVFAQAPWESSDDGGRQYTIAWSSNTLNDTFFDRTGDPVSVTGGRYTSNAWTDMWPIGFTDPGGNSYLFFTSERNPSDPSSEIAGNIWYLPVTWDVSRDHYTYIQVAIDNASTGDTINVAAGTYNESVTVNKSLTLEGANAGIPATGARGPESIIDAQLADYGVFIIEATTTATLDGFTVRNYEVGGILAGGFSPPEDDPFAVHILNNVVEEPSSLEDAHNNNIQVGDGTTGTIIGNEVSGALLESPDWSGSGIIVAGSSNVVISNNYVHDCEGGIQIIGYAEYRDAPAENNIIENNLVEGNEGGIIPQMNSIGTIIRYNDVLNNDEGIAVMAIDYDSWPEHSTPSGTEIHSNNIVGNIDGVVSGVWGSDAGGVLAEEVDATSNYWGAANGPKQADSNPSASGDEVSANVIYTPWLDAAYPDGNQRYYNVKNVTQDITYNCIQAAIDAAADEGDTINVLAGMYNECLNVNKSVSIVGAGVSQVTANVSGLSVNNAGIYVSADNVSLQGFTVLSNPADSIPRYGIKFGEVGGGSVTDILVRDIHRSGFDFLGSANTTISNVESRDNGGHGISLVDCNNITLSDITTSGSGWQAVSVATWGNYSPLGTSGIVFTGTNSFGNVFQLEEGDFNNPGVAPAGEAIITYSTDIAEGADVTVQASDFGYALHGDQDDGPDQNRVWFFKTLAEAKTAAPLAPVGHLLASGIYIESLTDRTQLYVSPGCEIQAAVDAATPGNTINVAPGTYTEAIAISTPLTLRGATADVNKNGYTVPAEYAWDDTVESIINHPDPAGGYLAIVDIVDTDNVTFEGFVVQELHAEGNKNSSLIRVRAQTDNVSDVVIKNNVIGPNTKLVGQDGTHGRMGLYLVNNPYSDLYGIVNSTFSGNKIFDTKGNGNNVFIWSSYYGYGAAGPASMSGTVIEDNEISSSHRSGIETAGGFSGLTIRNNSIHGNYKLEGDTPDLKYGNGILMIRGSSDRDNIEGLGPVDVTIEDNEIYNNDGHGIYMGPNNEGITITHNSLYDNGQDAIIVDLIGNYWNPDFEDDTGPHTNLAGSDNITAHLNRIYDNDEYGIRVIGEPENGFVLDATNNWWGTKESAAVAAKVSSYVDYDPWWANAEGTELGSNETFTISATAVGGGTISPLGDLVVNYGASREFTITPGTGYKIEDVLIDDVSVLEDLVGNTYTFENIIDDHTIHATFTLTTYTITASATEGGTISPSGAIAVEHGERQTFTIRPSTGYEISAVLVDGVSVGKVARYTFDNVTANHTIRVVFTLKTYNLTVSSTDGGSVTAPGEGTSTYNEGTVVDLWAVPDEGYRFVNWTGDVNTIADINAASTTITMEGDYSITADFELTSAQKVSIDKAALGDAAIVGTNPDLDNVTTNLNLITVGAVHASVITWASSDPAVITTDGTVTRPAFGVGDATLTLTATITNGAATDTKIFNVTVKQHRVDAIEIVPDNPTITLGQTQRFTATGTYSDGSTEDLTATVGWSSSNENVAAIDAAGLATSVGVGVTNITATLNGITSPAAVLTVTQPAPVSIAVTPTTASVAAGYTQEFTATGTYADGSTQNISEKVIWKSSNVAVATINSAGLATSRVPGTSSITASLGRINSPAATLTVTAAVLTDIMVTPANTTIALGKTQQFHAIGTYSDGSWIEITAIADWTSGTTAVATIEAHTGLATSAGAGATVITASLDGMSSHTSLTVTDALLVSIAVVPAAPSIAAGQMQQFAATGTYSDNSTQNITGVVTWASSNTSVARINAAGLARSFASGTSSITASLDGVTSLATTLTITVAVLDSISIVPINPALTFVAGAPPTIQFTATGIYTDGSTLRITDNATWTSSDTGIATIGGEGLATTLAAGTTTISATFGGKSASTTFTVLADTVAPVVTLARPTNGLTLNTNTLTVSGSINDINATAMVIVNGTPFALNPDAEGNFSHDVILKTGNNSILVRAVDGMGNTGTSGTRNVAVDPLKPAITITSPADQTVTRNSSITITGTVTNTAQVTLRVNGATQSVTITGGNFNATATLTEGKNIIAASAYTTGHEGDTNYRGTSGAMTVVRDTTPPEVTITSPSMDAVFSIRNINVIGTVDDPAVNSVILMLNDIPQTVPVADGDFNQSITLVPGDNTIVIMATDRVGNTSSTGPVTVTMDNTKPGVTVTAPANRLVTNIAAQTITGTVDDPAIWQATLYVNGTAQTISVAPDGSFRRTVPLNVGANTIEVRVQDNATPPNIGTSGVINVTVDTTPPTLTIGLSDPTDSIIISVTSNEPLAAPPTVNVNPPVTMTQVGINQWAGTYGSANHPIVSGNYVVTITGTDRAGNTASRTATFSKETINVDGVNPTTVDSGTTSLQVETDGAVTDADITVTQHTDNPSGNVGSPDDAAMSGGAFVEINAAPELLDNLRQIYIRVNYDPDELPPDTDESSLKLYLWDVTLGTWQLVPGSGVNVEEKYIYGTVTHLSEYGVFGSVTPAPPSPPTPGPAAGGGGESELQPGTTDIRGFVTTTGRFTRSVTATSEDKICTLTIPTGTVGLTSDLEPLTEITMLTMDEPPPPPEGAHIIGLAYEFGPGGATFDPSISLNWSYDPDSLPEGVAEENLVIAYYDEDTGKWVELDCTVDTENDTITASVPHFTTFAVIGEPKPANFTFSSLTISPTEVAPDEEITIGFSVANTGGREGTYPAVLKINGVQEAEKLVTVAAGNSQMVTFSVFRKEAGSYSVTVNGMSGSFTVVAPSEPEITPTPEPTAPEITPTPTTEPAKPLLPAEQPGEELPSETRGWVIAVEVLAALAVLAIAFIVIRSRTRARRQ